MKRVFKKSLKSFLKIFLCLTFIGGCTSFHHLTILPAAKNEGPSAVDCSSCHGEQFQEWSGSPHAMAYQNSAFQEAYGDFGDEECLHCHAPLAIRQGDRGGRAFRREEGVTCSSCHLSRGTMHGPHKSSALFHPHPVQEEDGFYLSGAICAVCHGETSDEYRLIAESREVPSCLECHAGPRRRTTSQGTNLFSNILVAFEGKVETRSHMISLDRMAPLPYSVQLVVLPLEQGASKGGVEVEITNNLPHNLPTGTFGEKNIQLALRFFQDDKVVAENVLMVSDEGLAMMAGEVKRFAVSGCGPVQHADRLEMRLERHASRVGVRPAVIIAAKTISLPVEKMR